MLSGQLAGLDLRAAVRAGRRQLCRRLDEARVLVAELRRRHLLARVADESHEHRARGLRAYEQAPLGGLVGLAAEA